jgi:hypothetical protein
MSKPNFASMSRDELAHYMVAHRDTPEGIEARQAFISQMAKRAESRGIEFYRSPIANKENAPTPPTL